MLVILSKDYARSEESHRLSFLPMGYFANAQYDGRNVIMPKRREILLAPKLFKIRRDTWLSDTLYRTATPF